MPNLKLILSIIDFLKEESKRESINPDTQESLEVAVQCLETAYDIDPIVAKNTLKVTLEEIFENSFPDDGSTDGERFNQTIDKAETMKNLGNTLMKNNQYTEAIKYYTAAIELESQNPIYYCNRAAAYSKLDDFQNSVKDCNKAIEIDPMYAKAYGRLGFAYNSLGRTDDAIKALKTAAELDPFNNSYLSNLKNLMEKKDKPADQASGAGLPGLSGVDWSSLFSNPEFRNMASTIMQDPNIINALSGLSANIPGLRPNGGSSAGSADGPPSSTTPSSGQQPASLDMLLEAGQYLAAQMQAANPDLVNQFRQAASRDAQNQDNKDSSGQ